MPHALLDLVLPAECAGCHRAGRTWCRRCDRALASLALPGGPSTVLPDPPLSGQPVTVAWGLYGDPLRAAVTAWKDEGRRDLLATLAPLLAAAVEVACGSAGWTRGPVLIVPAPSSSRSTRVRGDTPLVDLAEAVVAALTARTGLAMLRLAPALRPSRGIRDQAGLSAASRAVNLRRAHVVASPWLPVVQGRRCLIVDDVLTTGTTLTESARALAQAGALEVRAATVAMSRRRASPRFTAASTR